VEFANDVNCDSIYCRISIQLNLSISCFYERRRKFFRTMMQDDRGTADKSRRAVSRSLFFLAPRSGGGSGGRKGREHGEFMINARETRDLI
jgi:hypothetical protein